jgi:uncharacterized protein YggE
MDIWRRGTMRILKVQGKGRVNVEPDLVTLSFQIESKEVDYAECLLALNTHTEDVRTSITAVGLDRTALKTTAFAVRYDREYVDGKSVFVGYCAYHHLHIELPVDKALLNRVLRKIAKGHSGAEIKLTFSVKDKAALRKLVLADAVQTAKDNAATLAAAAGVTLGKLQQIDYGWAEVRIYDRDASMICDGVAEPIAPEYEPDIEPEDVAAEDNVTLVYEIGG